MNKIKYLLSGALLSVLLLLGTQRASAASSPMFSVANCWGGQTCQQVLNLLGSTYNWIGQDGQLGSGMAATNSTHVFVTRAMADHFQTAYPPCMQELVSTNPYTWYFINEVGAQDKGARCKAFLATLTGYQYFVIGNEPNGFYSMGGDEMSAAVFAQFYKQAVEKLTGFNPIVRPVVGAWLDDGTKDAVNDCAGALAPYLSFINYYHANYGTVPGAGVAFHIYTGGFQDDVDTLHYVDANGNAQTDANRSMTAVLSCFVNTAGWEYNNYSILANGQVFLTETGINPGECYNNPDFPEHWCTAAKGKAFAAHWFNRLQDPAYFQQSNGTTGLARRYWWQWGMHNPNTPGTQAWINWNNVYGPCHEAQGLPCDNDATMMWNNVNGTVALTPLGVCYGLLLNGLPCLP